MSTFPYSLEATAWQEPEPTARPDAFLPATFAFVLLQMAALIAVSVTGLRSPLVYAGTVMPVLLVSLFQPFVGLCTMFAVVLYEDLFTLVGGILTLTKLLALFTGIGYLFRCQRREYTVIPSEAMTRLGIAFALLCMISAVWARFPTHAFLNALTPALLAICMLMASQMINTRARLRTILMCVTLACTLGGLAMIVNPGIVRHIGGTERATIGEANANRIAELLVLGVFAATYLLWTTRSWVTRMTLVFAIVVILGAELATKSRTGFAAMVLGFLAGALLGLRGGFSQRLVLLITLGLVSLGGYMLVVATDVAGHGAFERWSDVRRGADSRTYIWKVGLQVWRDNPAIGVGFAGFSAEYSDVAHEQNRYRLGLRRDPHNTFLKVLCELGPLGLLILLSMFFVIAIYAFRVRPGPDANLAFALVTALPVISMAGSMVTVKYFWYTLAVLVAMGKTIPEKEGNEITAVEQGYVEVPPAFIHRYA